jgi:rhodanese-related sulfurtransferase
MRIARLFRYFAIPLFALTFAGLAAPARADEAAIGAMQEYMEFATYEAGIILPQQVTKEIFDSVLFVDTRDAGQFKAETIPGAVNIEWREVLGRIDEIPTDRKVILFCNTGTLSAQAAFALRVAGRDNVTVLQTGLTGWKANAAYKP